MSFYGVCLLYPDIPYNSFYIMKSGLYVKIKVKTNGEEIRIL